MKNRYEITFDTKKGGRKYSKIHIEADTAKDAKETVKKLWENDNRLNDMHMFHINVKRLKLTDEFLYHYFVRLGE